MHLIGKPGCIHGARMLDELDSFVLIRLACSNKAEVCASREVTDNGIEGLMDLQVELRAHENEIRKLRQELETRIQTHRMREIISSHGGLKKNATNLT
jgi:hypothetical protein